MQTFWQDVRFTVRQLRRAPFFSLTVILTLAIAVGATAVMAGVLRATLLNSLPYPHAEELVQIRDQNLRGFKTNGIMSFARIGDLEKMQHDGKPVFSSLGYFYPNDGTLRWNGHAALGVSGAAVSGDFFRVVGTDPLIGRTVTPADNVPKAPQVVVLSHHLWTTAFGRDPSVVGRVVNLGADQATIVGVMPESFRLPEGTDLWYPAQLSSAQFAGWRGEGSRFLNVFARLAPKETRNAATRQVGLLATQLATAYPDTDAAWGSVSKAFAPACSGKSRMHWFSWRPRWRWCWWWRR